MQNNIKQHQKGFTLIEMIVVIAIIATVSTLVLFSQTKMNSTILVSNTAYEIGLIVREAQVAGLSVKATSNTSAGFLSSHGVHFNKATPSIIIAFVDTNNNGAYDATLGEMTQEYTIDNSRAGKLLGICKLSALGPTTSNYCIGSNSDTTLDVVFTRPNPEALFKVRPASGGTAADYIGAVTVTVGFEGDICRSIVIEKTGAIGVNNIYCLPVL
jgi:prepilin-type N-terminal cleavage/methylation domain-containing protein